MSREEEFLNILKDCWVGRVYVFHHLVYDIIEQVDEVLFYTVSRSKPAGQKEKIFGYTETVDNFKQRIINAGYTRIK